jgi:hypothetical protein
MAATVTLATSYTTSRDTTASASPRAYLVEAQTYFPGLSKRSFRKLWDDLASDAWKRGGRPLAHQTGTKHRPD